MNDFDALMAAAPDIAAPFQTFADANSISLEDVEDWQPWFDCFEAGYKAGNRGG